VFIGYDINHADDVYRMLNTKTQSIIKSRVIVWLNKSYGAWIKSKNDTSVNDDSGNQVDNLKNKSETDIPSSDAPNDCKNKTIANFS
jgi:hypothetical protein